MNNFNRSNLYTRTFQNDNEPTAIPAWFYTLAFGLIVLVVIVR
jgi:hypothetical protein